MAILRSGRNAGNAALRPVTRCGVHASDNDRGFGTVVCSRVQTAERGPRETLTRGSEKRTRKGFLLLRSSFLGSPARHTEVQTVGGSLVRWRLTFVVAAFHATLSLDATSFLPPAELLPPLLQVDQKLLGCPKVRSDLL